MSLLTKSFRNRQILSTKYSYNLYNCQLRFNTEKLPQNIERVEIPEHLTRRGKRKIPEPFLRQLKQIKPISQGIFIHIFNKLILILLKFLDNFGKGLVVFIVTFTLFINGLYAYQAYSLKDRLKSKGIIGDNSDDDERWENLKKSV